VDRQRNGRLLRNCSLDEFAGGKVDKAKTEVLGALA
jgi:hypothetical protein